MTASELLKEIPPAWRSVPIALNALAIHPGKWIFPSRMMSESSLSCLQDRVFATSDLKLHTMKPGMREYKLAFQITPAGVEESERIIAEDMRKEPDHVD